MALTREDITHIAKLARLDVAEDEAEMFRNQLSSILEFVDKLSQAETDDVEPMNHVVPVHNAWREDKAEPCPAAMRDAVIAEFPEREGDLLKVKTVF
ncbi:MAG: Asp-tRNA(Asn)/Glu-tRNA(Gln) amidotransferase subunit GatC [Patescibacteria group bacterium]